MIVDGLYSSSLFSSCLYADREEKTSIYKVGSLRLSYPVFNLHPGENLNSEDFGNLFMLHCKFVLQIYWECTLFLLLLKEKKKI